MEVHLCEQCKCPCEFPLCSECLKELFEGYDKDELNNPVEVEDEYIVTQQVQ